MDIHKILSIVFGALIIIFAIITVYELVNGIDEPPALMLAFVAVLIADIANDLIVRKKKKSE